MRKQLTLNFNDKFTDALIKCENCGKCCTGSKFKNLILLYSDVERIEKKLNKSISDSLEKVEFCNKMFPALKQPCRFYNNGCTIYDVRPLSCRQFPLIYGNGEILVEDSFCPAAKKLLDDVSSEYKFYMEKNFPEVEMKKDFESKYDLNTYFAFNNGIYKYFEHPYNKTFNNERKVEVPIIIEYIDKHKEGEILEVGNVLSHYFTFNHDTVDRDEKFEKIINQDIIDYHPDKKYKLIVSISTLEHVGFDGMNGQYNIVHNRIPLAFDNIMSLLEKGGKFVFTVPLGYNYELDEYLFSNKFKLDEVYCMKKNIETKRWEQISFRKLNPLDIAHHLENVIENDSTVHTVRRVTHLVVGIKNK